ncbi:MAG: flagellar basal body L-ring protein FlgH [Chitinispirillaceae bacterium]|nr:flagellar basal body L-ring protein FlgH [Chitinispirillaceae bacterium]
MRNIIRISLFTLFTVSCSISASQVPNLFSDQRAIKIDDIVTILIVESAKAGSESQTNTDKAQSFGVESRGGTGVLRMLPQFSGSGGTKIGYDGKGNTSREGTLTATISARVLKVLDNGNLVIEGSKIVEVNEEKGIIKISGVIRPLDIQQNNVVYSSSIADANITYSGKGVANTAQRPGILARIINWIF